MAWKWTAFWKWNMPGFACLLACLMWGVPSEVNWRYTGSIRYMLTWRMTHLWSNWGICSSHFLTYSMQIPEWQREVRRLWGSTRNLFFASYSLQRACKSTKTVSVVILNVVAKAWCQEGVHWVSYFMDIWINLQWPWQWQWTCQMYCIHNDSHELWLIKGSW